MNPVPQPGDVWENGDKQVRIDRLTANRVRYIILLTRATEELLTRVFVMTYTLIERNGKAVPRD